MDNYILDIVNLTSSWKNRLNWDEYFMCLAFLASSRSPCDRLKVGCVIVKNNRIMSMGYNGFLPKAAHKSIVRNDHEQATVHAEQNAICHAAKEGINIKDSTAYITHFPCINCAKVLISAGIETIYYHFDYKNDEVIIKIIENLNINIKKI